ncbi:hypothetical protein [Planktothricoides raciborskii]|uniref:Uncharacterized protein n=1 Tax=Planktothricoides raciborskii FACHB-1370 TaxID=2949576 RepID=A0ABR8EFU3_9CYAN|nr:hypothetical protein [Planktothricoides raciborskii]MBD2544471.1 hypothetical protein [Planktothricoides raciborskii FACHB-1370]
MEKELLGQKNRVSVVGIRSYLWDAIKKPGFWGSGGGCWGKETGFLLLVSGVICGSEKETRFLGFWGWLLGQRNRVSVVGIRSYLWQRERNPVSSHASFKEGEA